MKAMPENIHALLLHNKENLTPNTTSIIILIFIVFFNRHISEDMEFRD